MIWSIRERSAIARVSREGRRVRAGVLWCSCLFDPETSMPMPPRVAFAIGRQVGSAVVRNRIRRRLRMLLNDSPLPPGTYLLGVRPEAATATFSQLSTDVTRLIAAISAANTRSIMNPADSSGS